MPNMNPTAAHTTTSSNTSQSRRRNVQNYSLIWVDGTIDKSEDEWKNNIEIVEDIISDINIFKKPEECIPLLNTINMEKILVITSGFLGEILVRDIHNLLQLDAIYILCGNAARHKAWAENCIWPAKSRSIGTILHVFGSFKEIILEIDDADLESFNKLIEYCHQQKVPESQLAYFHHEYHRQSPIWWYTKDLFIYGMLNKALRTFNVECMLKMGFFIRKLHQQIEQLYYKQLDDYRESFTVYRDQALSQQNFQKLLTAKDGLLSFNSFLLGSKNRKVSMSFVEDSLRKTTDTVGILFIITINQKQISTSTTPFAMIDDYSAICGEQHILFTMHTVFHVSEITPTVSNNRLWEVSLTLTQSHKSL
ncbi:unnamed protein product [Rotaria magnacalcarata]|uniref:Uncharacterized protein n=1 Tax=Rotaria magnacalcarata TaxID=392030 RepID=A0A816YF03_9BILA|nr:unnamed protein product [Rotaria magnacalcarata]CAF4101206.1 unnamed protein product [Rotaria magnacalcarata]